MAVGDIFEWHTDQAAGYDLRKKMHVYLCDAGWRENGKYAFLFISSADYGGDFKISEDDYKFLDHESFISTSGMVFYTQDELNRAKPGRLGRLRREHVDGLCAAIDNSDFMEGWQIKLAIEALVKIKG